MYFYSWHYYLTTVSPINNLKFEKWYIAHFKEYVFNNLFSLISKVWEMNLNPFIGGTKGETYNILLYYVEHVVIWDCNVDTY